MQTTVCQLKPHEQSHTPQSLAQGDVMVIAGQAWHIKLQPQREQLIKRIQKDGFEHTMETVA